MYISAENAYLTDRGLSKTRLISKLINMNYEKNIFENHESEIPLASCHHKATHIRLDDRNLEFGCSDCEPIYASSGFMKLNMRHFRKLFRR